MLAVELDETFTKHPGLEHTTLAHCYAGKAKKSKKTKDSSRDISDWLYDIKKKTIAELSEMGG